MNGLNQLFTAVLLQPILNLLIWLYDVIPGQSIGLAIILLTVVVKLVLYPFTVAQIRQQRALQELQPKIDEIRARLKDQKEEQARELMALYAKEKVNPASSCLPLLIQLPVFIALYRALQIGIEAKNLALLYPFVPHPQSIDPMFLGFINLAEPSYILALVAALVQYVQTKHILKPPAPLVSGPPPEVAGSKGSADEGMATIMNKQMAYVMPIVTAVIGFSLPGGLTLYWFVMSLLTLLQQWRLMGKTPPKTVPQLPN